MNNWPVGKKKLQLNTYTHAASRHTFQKKLLKRRQNLYFFPPKVHDNIRILGSFQAAIVALWRGSVL